MAIELHCCLTKRMRYCADTHNVTRKEPITWPDGHVMGFGTGIIFGNLILAAITDDKIWIATRPTSHSFDQDTSR